MVSTGSNRFDNFVYLRFFLCSYWIFFCCNFVKLMGIALDYWNFLLQYCGLLENLSPISKSFMRSSVMCFFFFGNLVICWWKLMSILIDSYMFSYMLFEGPTNLRKIFHLKTIRTFFLDVLFSFMKFFILYFAKLKGFKLNSYIIFILPNTYLYYVLLASWKNSSISLISDMNECWV